MDASTAGRAGSPGYRRLASRNRLSHRKWFARPRKVADPRLRLICFPHIAGGAALYNAWADGLPPHVELCAARLPGRENRTEEPFADTLPALIDDLESAIAPLIDQPFVLFGHCSGSLIAFHLARRLRAVGKPPPALLIVSSLEAPAVRVVEEPMHLLPREELLRRFADYGGITSAVLDDPDLMDLFEPVIRADYRLIETAPYEPEPPLTVPLIVVGGRHDRFVDRAALTAWKTETTQEFALRLLDTGHFVLEPALDLVVAQLDNLLRIDSDGALR